LKPRAANGAPRKKKPSSNRCANNMNLRATPTTPPPVCGTTASLIRLIPAVYWAWRWPWPTTNRTKGRKISACFGCSTNKYEVPASPLGGEGQGEGAIHPLPNPSPIKGEGFGYKATLQIFVIHISTGI